MSRKSFRTIRPGLILAAAMALQVTVTGCAPGNVRAVQDDEYNDYRTKGAQRGKLFGEQGLAIGIGGKGGSGSTNDGGGGLGVNAYLWRAALDTLSFMPLANADPFGGTIITDWYQPAAAGGERFKATAYILGRQLRADGIKVSVFRQQAQGGQWVDAPVAASTASEIENKMLARARELRSQATGT